MSQQIEKLEPGETGPKIFHFPNTDINTNI